MDKPIICETDRGRYAVRPMSWAGIWNEKGQIKESLNHLALFIEKEDAEKFVEWKEAEKQGKLLKLPCAAGDIIWDIDFGRPYSYEVAGFSFGSMNDDDWEEEQQKQEDESQKNEELKDEVSDDNGGKTDGGTPPATNPIPDQGSQEVTVEEKTENPDSSETITETTGQTNEGVNSGEVDDF